MRILLIEDDDSLRTILGLLLEELGYCTVTQLASMDGLKLLKERLQIFSVAILDINLGPNQANGVDCYHWMRSNGYQGRVIFLTGHARSHPLVKEAGEIGDAQVLEKPTGIEKLVSIISERAHEELVKKGVGRG